MFSIIAARLFVIVTAFASKPGRRRCRRTTTQLTDEEPHVGATVKLLPVHFAQHTPGGHHVEQADNDAGVLAPQIAHRIGGIGEERLSCYNLDGRLLAAVLQVLDRLFEGWCLCVIIDKFV